MHMIWHCCVENVHAISLLWMVRWCGYKWGNVCMMHAVSHNVIHYLRPMGGWNSTLQAAWCVMYILSEYDGFGNFTCRFDEIQHFFYFVWCCVLVTSFRACALACLARPLVVGMLAQAQWTCKPYETVLYGDTSVWIVCKSKNLSYAGYSNTFSNDAIVRIPHAQGSEPGLSTTISLKVTILRLIQRLNPCHSPCTSLSSL